MTSNSSQDPTDPTALVDDIIAELQTAFRTSVTNLKSAIAAYVRDRTLPPADAAAKGRSEEHTSELQSLMRISYAVFCLKKKKKYQSPIAAHTESITMKKTKNIDDT